MWIMEICGRDVRVCVYDFIFGSAKHLHWFVCTYRVLVEYDFCVTSDLANILSDLYQCISYSS